ncbi:MAG: SusC/RagA family TonB-linked outer membrane protein [Bacteroidales bacterium]|nr:SusC/RagA family TonB-linked outer membrane protein [Bacteroidales bacterium]
MKKNLFVFLTTVLLFASFGLSAQNVKVSGNVKEADGIGAVGAGVLIKGTSIGTITDLNGDFAIECKKGETLIISYLGFKDKEVVADGEFIDVTLESDATALDEVVVLGYGIAQKKQDLSASVGVLKDPAKITMRAVTGSTAMLQGQIPGVTVQENSGDPTAGHSMVVRGQGSRNGDSVLWIVDGVPGAAIPSVDEIESMVVLKDAASAAIYGAQSGAGGVVIVTTKQAKKTEGVRVEYDGQVNFAKPTNILQPLTAQELIDMRRQSCIASGMSDPYAGLSEDFMNYVSTNRTNWVNEITRLAISHRHNAAIAFGNEHAKSRLVFSYNDKEGTLLNTFSKGLNVNYKGDYDINRYVKISENFNWGTGRSRGTNTSSETSGSLINAIYAPSFSPAWGENGKFASWLPEEWSSQSGLMGDCYNPLRQLLGDDNWNRSQSMQSHTALVLHDIVPGLKFTSRFSYWMSHNYYKNYHYYRYEITGRQESSSSTSSELSEGASTSANWKTENTLSYDKVFGKHTVSAMVSTTADANCTGYSLGISGLGFDDEDAVYHYIPFTNNPKTPSDGFNGRDSNIAIIARLAYSWNDRYFLTASWRRDYAGRLPYAHNHADFPAFTAAWKISNEKFFEPLRETIDLLKIRGSWGRVGNINSIGWNYASNNLYNSRNTNERPQYGITNAGTWGNIVYNGRAINNTLTWETSQQWNIGFDAAMFKNRLNIGFDYYNKRTYNLIQGQTTNWPGYMGFDAPSVNQGEIANRGVELTLGWSDTIGSDMNYYVRGNFSHNHNEIISTGVKNEDGSWAPWTGGGSFRNVPYCYQSIVGGPLNQFYLIKCLGMFQSWEDIYDHQKDGKLIQPAAQPGDLKFEDFNGDGKIDDADRQYMGAATPNITFALSAGFSWKNLSLDMMLQGVADAQVYYPGQTMIYSDAEGNFSRAAGIKNSWGYNGNTTNATLPRLARNDSNGNYTKPSTFFLEDGSYVRLKSLTLSYNLTDLARKWAHLNDRGSTVTAYVTGENLFTLTKYSGMDPECGGFDSVKYPVARTISLGVKIAY